MQRYEASCTLSYLHLQSLERRRLTADLILTYRIIYVNSCNKKLFCHHQSQSERNGKTFDFCCSSVITNVTAKYVHYNFQTFSNTTSNSLCCYGFIWDK